MSTKYCPGTATQPGHTLLTAAFSPDKNRGDKLCAYCKTCIAEKQRLWKHRNADKVKAAKKAYRQRKAGG